MVTDRQSNALSNASARAADLFDDAVHSFNIYCGDPLARLDEAIAESPAFAQAHLFKAFILALATEPAATAQARDIAKAVRTMSLNEREASQLAILEQLLAGNWVAAATAMDFHNMRYPRDLVALQVGHLLDFYRGSARDLRDRMARALPHWSDEVPGCHAVVGDACVRSRGDRRLRTRGGGWPSRPRPGAARRLGAPRRRARDGDAGACGGRCRLDDGAGAALGWR